VHTEQTVWAIIRRFNSLIPDWFKTKRKGKPIKSWNTGACYVASGEEGITDPVDPNEKEWVLPEFAADGDNATRTFCEYNGEGQYSRILLLTMDTNHFTLPADAVVLGVEAEVLYSLHSETPRGITLMELTVNGHPIGTGYGLLGSEIPIWEKCGNPDDDMTEDQGLTRSVVNDPTFGLWFRGYEGDIAIHNARLTIFYRARKAA